MTDAAGVAARPEPVRQSPYRYRAVVLRGYDPVPHPPPVGSPGSDLLGVEAGSYLVRLERLDGPALQAFERAAGVAGAIMRRRLEDGVIWLSVGRLQLEVLRNQLLAAPSDALRAAEEVASVLRAYHRQEFELRSGGRVLRCGARPLVMGIVNCTPDSFYGGSSVQGEAAVDRGLQMVREGADILDIGGESTRPGSEPVAAEEQIRRVVPVIERLAEHAGVPLSIDTSSAEVARAALEAGVGMINDISSLTADPELGVVAAAAGVPLVLMHTRGQPANMYGEAHYADIVAEVVAELRQSVGRALAAGVAEEAIIVDPGIGFAKRAEHSLMLLRHLASLRSLGRPILVGPSRKSFIGAVLDLPAEERVEGTAAAVAAAVLGGAHILRVHDVSSMGRVAAVAAAIRCQGAGWTS